MFVSGLLKSHMTSVYRKMEDFFPILSENLNFSNPGWDPNSQKVCVCVWQINIGEKEQTPGLFKSSTVLWLRHNRSWRPWQQERCLSAKAQGLCCYHIKLWKMQRSRAAPCSVHWVGSQNNALIHPWALPRTNIIMMTKQSRTYRTNEDRSMLFSITSERLKHIRRKKKWHTEKSKIKSKWAQSVEYLEY